MQPTTKQELRKIYRERRINLHEEQLQQLNDGLLAQVRTLDVGRFSTVHLFLPIAGNREPDTYAIAAWLKQAYPHIRLVLSKTDSGTHSMAHFIWDERTTLTPNKWGIPEPETGASVLPKELDAVFVPLLAFDTRGNRVGYGKGFYDRFLSECRAETAKIGLSLFEAVPIISDADEYDVALDACVTPYRTWWFNTIP